MSINAFIDIDYRRDLATVLVPEHEMLYVFRPLSGASDFTTAVASLDQHVVVHIDKYDAGFVAAAFRRLGIRVKHTGVKGVQL